MAGEDFLLKGKVVLDSTGLTEAGSGTEGLVDKFAKLMGVSKETALAMGGMAGAAAALAIGIKILTDDAYEAYCEFDRLGWVIGISAGEMAKWNQVAIYADSTASALSTMLAKMSVNLSDTGPAGEKARKVLTDMGIAVYDANGNIRELTDLFPEFVDGISKMTDTSVRNGAAMDVMGRGYKELAGYAILGADGIKEVYNTTQSLNWKQQADLGALEEKWKNLNRTMEENQMIMGAELAPAVWEVVDAIQTLMGLDDGEFFKNMVHGIDLAVDGFKVLVRGITLAIISLEIVNAMTRGDFMEAAAIRKRGTEYVQKYMAADKKDEFDSMWADNGGGDLYAKDEWVKDPKTGQKVLKKTLSAEDLKTMSAKEMVEAAEKEKKAGKEDPLARTMGYTPEQIGEMAVRNGVSVDTVIARLNLAYDSNKYGVSIAQYQGKVVKTPTNAMTKEDIAMYNELMDAGRGVVGSNIGYTQGTYAENSARYESNLKFAQADTTGDANLQAIKDLDTTMYNPVNNNRLNANYGYGSGTFASTSDEYMANYMKQLQAPTVNIVNYNYGSSSPEEIANATAEATSRELARQASLS